MGRARSLGGQASWSLLDQGASSLGTFVLSVAVARTSDLSGFGAFAIAFTVYTLTLTGSRALLTMPYMMKASVKESSPPLASGALGAVVTLSATGAGALAVAALIFDGSLRLYLLLIAVGLPALLLQDAYRYVLLQIHGMRSVAAIDAGWTGLQITLSLCVVLTAGTATGPWHLVAWLLGAGAAAIWGWRRTRIRPHVVDGWQFIIRTRRTGVPLMVEAFAISGGGAAAGFAVAAVGGLVALAPLRGASVVLGPVSVAIGGLLFLVTPIVLRTGASDKARLLRRCALFGGIVSMVSLVTASLVLLIPTEVGVELMGRVWVDSRPVIFPAALVIAVYSLETSAMLGFRAHHITTRTMVLRLYTFPVPALSAVAGLLWGGPVGAAYGMAAAGLGTAAALWWMLARLPASSPSGTADEPVQVLG